MINVYQETRVRISEELILSEEKTTSEEKAKITEGDF